MKKGAIGILSAVVGAAAGASAMGKKLGGFFRQLSTVRNLRRLSQLPLSQNTSPPCMR
mgnify:CR=1 FL=1